MAQLKNSICYFRQTADLMNVCDSKRKAGWHISGAARFLRFWLLLSFSIKSAFWNHTIDGGYFVSVIRIICPGSARTGGRVYLLLLICTSLSLCLFGHIHFMPSFFRLLHPAPAPSFPVYSFIQTASDTDCA